MGSIILIRSLVLALACAYAAAGLTPLSAAGDDNDCALYLSGPGRTSSYDYSINLLKGNFGYEGQHTCITYDAVNQAYLEARNRIVVSQPKGDWKAEDFASVGELILDISINLARTYGLTYEEIEKGLPLIDTSRTLIREVCPPVFSHVECRAGKYRRIDGLCNNLQQPTWGATNAPFQRLIGPLFADGINAPRISHTGRNLPLSRVVSRTMHPDEGFHDHAGTVMVIAWGQFMDHDYTLTGTPLDPRNRNDPEECCKRPPHLKHPYCNEIKIPDDDYFYRLFNVKCIDFVRGFPSPRPGCRLGSRVPFNTLTGALDGNTVYGVTDKFARKLRTGYGGLLRMNPVFKEYGLKDLLPLKLDIPDEGCTRPNKNMYCFEAGEIRVNEQLVLTVMHTLMAREHNRVAGGLAAVNPHWDDETLYQEARRINIAEIQHITYNEFLPILLGKDVMEKFGLVLEKKGYWDGYDPHVNPDVIDAFASAAYRFGHSLLPTAVERWSKAHKFIASKRLSDLIRRPYDLYRAGVLDEYVMGLMNQVAQAMDDSITQEVTNHLFKKVGARFGMDLVSFNMQRGREFGVPGYMEFRKFCGLPGAESFQDLFGAMSNETVRKYETIFEHPIDVDLWSGGVSERPLPGSMLGPTFACIIATQFSYSRRGDRFWFELPHQPSSFTPEQLHEIRKSRLARVICDNTDIIDTVQLYPMVLPDHELNPRVPCRSGIIPSMDFSKWAEPAPGYQGAGAGAAKQFITEAFISPYNVTSVIAAVVNKTEDAQSSSNQEHIKVKGTLNNDTSLRPTDQKDLHKCAENFTNTGGNCKETYVKMNDTHNSDIILKYVNKQGEKSTLREKYAGHYKNTLKRRKRYAKNFMENARYAASAPAIVSYKTHHTPLVSANIKNSANVIQGLADFNIETLHDNEPKNINSALINDALPNVYHQSSKYPHILNKIKEHINDKDYKHVPSNFNRKSNRHPLTSRSNLRNYREENEKPKNIPYTRNHKSKDKVYRESDEEIRKGSADGGNPYRLNDKREDNHSEREEASSYEESTENIDSRQHKPRQESIENEDYRDDREINKTHRDSEEQIDNNNDKKSYKGSEERESYRDDSKTRNLYRDSGERDDYNNDKKPFKESKERESYRDDSKTRNLYRNSGERDDYNNDKKPFKESKERESYRDDSKTRNLYRDSGERDDYNNDKKPYKGSEDRESYRDDSKTPNLYRDSGERDDYNNDKKPYKGSEEKEIYRDDRKTSKPYRDSREQDDYNNEGKNRNSPQQIEERNKYHEGRRHIEPYRDSKESEEYNDRKNNRHLDDRNIKPYIDSEEKQDYKDTKNNGKVYQTSEEENIDRDSKENDETFNKSSEKANYLHTERNTKPYSESDERDDYHDKRKISPYQEKNENKFRDGQAHIDESEERSDSRETDTESYREKKKQKENEHYYSKDNKSPYSTLQSDSNESQDQESNRKPFSNRSAEESNGSQNEKPYIKSRDKSGESKENSSYEPVERPLYYNNHEINQDGKNSNIRQNSKILQPDSNENEEEEIIAIMTKKKSKKPAVLPRADFKDELNSPLNVTSPIKIQEVDLGDFSYETIHVSDQGKVVPSQDTYENYGTSNTAEPLTTTPIPGTDFIQSKKLLESLMNVDDPIDDNFNNFAKHTIKINHGEIKPVVEINTDSGEIHDESENNNKEVTKSGNNNEDTSLETLLGVKIPEDNEQNDKLVEKQLEPESRKVNVKQEFERIPLNYNHDNDVQTHSNKEGTITAPEDTTEKNTETSPPTEGTLDTFTPPTRYDDHLNIKFDDEPIKLPEIELPEDILSYAYEKPSYVEDTNSRKPKFYHYSDEYNDEPSQKNKKIKGNDESHDDDDDDDDDDHDHSEYYGYHGDEHKSDYKSKKKAEEEEEDEDLYEKFVRERFGKRPFKTNGKSEKLEDLRPVAADTKLYNTLRQVLKKTHNIQNEAEKSGDPNAGYMWTLEYGQPL